MRLTFTDTALFARTPFASDPTYPDPAMGLFANRSPCRQEGRGPKLCCEDWLIVGNRRDC